jgi:hypothetical protein
MDQEKLRKIIADKNDRLEDNALHTAACLIEGIAQEQKKIEASQTRIAELRKELTTLTVDELNADAILGV